MLSTVTITHNEESNIERCLKSLSFADERLVVDSGSTDRTVELAQAAGAHVIKQPWLGYGPQKNVGLEAATGDWVLFIDADEEVGTELSEEIRAVIGQNKPAKDFYWLRVVTVFLGRPLKHLYGHNLRLFKKDSGRWTDAKVHEQVQRKNNLTIQQFNNSSSVIHLGDPDAEILRNHLLHHSHPTIRSYLATIHEYTTLDAKEMARTGRHRSGRPVKRSSLLPWQLATRQWLKLMFYRRGILDGWQGWVWCALSGYYEWEMGKKFLKNPI